MNTNPIHHINQAIAALLDDDTDKALGRMIRASVALSDMEAEPPPLPDPQPQRSLYQTADEAKAEIRKAKDRARKQADRDRKMAEKYGDVELGTPVHNNLKAIEVPCPRCGAKRNKPCFVLTGRGKYSKPTSETNPDFMHKARRDSPKRRGL